MTTEQQLMLEAHTRRNEIRKTLRFLKVTVRETEKLWHRVYNLAPTIEYRAILMAIEDAKDLMVKQMDLLERKLNGVGR